MSGFLGLFNLDERPVERMDVEQMTDLLAHRGPDGSGIFCRTSIGLGHRRLNVTPQSLHESLPLVSHDRRVVVTADARIDNRAELLSWLSIPYRTAGVITDSELILAAYQQWGETCTNYLVGDFAFAIWDEAQHKLFCARDHLGMKPFYYYFRPGQIFVCASEIKALLYLPDVPQKLNEIRVGDFLARSFEDREITFYQEIVRLPSASQLTVDRQGIRIQRYWEPDLENEILLSSQAEYNEAFLAVFDEAVRCRLRSHYPVSSTLSGGLDSSSVAATAAELLANTGIGRLHAFSAIFPKRVSVDPTIDERQFMQAVAAHCNIEQHPIRADQLSPFVPEYWCDDEPLPGVNLYMDCAFLQTANQLGARVLLTGHDGDTVISYGYELLPALARSFRWARLYQESKALGQRKGVHGLSVMWAHGFLPLFPTVIQELWDGLRGQKQHEPSVIHDVHPKFAAELDLLARIEQLNASNVGKRNRDRHMHWHAINSGSFAYIAEVLDHLAAQHSVEIRHPFFDKRLIEFTLALPLEQKLHNGWPRSILRLAMEKRLPEMVRWRQTKADLSVNFKLGLLEHEQDALETVICCNDDAILTKYVDLERLGRVYRRYAKEPMYRGVEAMTLNTSVILAKWLQHRGFA